MDDSNGIVKVALLQMRSAGSVEANMEVFRTQVESAAARGAKILCTSELFRSWYFFEASDHDYFSHGEVIPGPFTDLLCGIASRLGIVLVASTFEKRGDGLFHSSAMAIDANGELLGVYRKVHVTESKSSHEAFYSAPGDRGFCSFQTAYGRIGVLLGWDQWFPEAARLTALQGAKILLYSTAAGFHEGDSRHSFAGQEASWRTVLRGHAIANGVYVAVTNRVGIASPPPRNARHGADGAPLEGVQYWGGSFVANPSGQVIASASGTEEEVVVVECDLRKIDVQRTHWPLLRDRRVDAYGDICRMLVD